MPLDRMRIELAAPEHLYTRDEIRELCETLYTLLHRDGVITWPWPDTEHWATVPPHTSHEGIYGLRYREEPT